MLLCICARVCGCVCLNELFYLSPIFLFSLVLGEHWNLSAAFSGVTIMVTVHTLDPLNRGKGIDRSK